jgi:hypothetical protein
MAEIIIDDEHLGVPCLSENPYSGHSNGVRFPEIVRPGHRSWTGHRAALLNDNIMAQSTLVMPPIGSAGQNSHSSPASVALRECTARSRTLEPQFLVAKAKQEMPVEAFQRNLFEGREAEAPRSWVSCAPE